MIPVGLVPTKKPCPPLSRRAELAVAQAGIDQHVVRPAVGDDQVGDAVAVQVGQLDGAGGEQAGGLVAQHGGLAGAVLDDHAIEPLVGVDEVGLAVAGQIGHGQRHRLVGLAIGAEGAVAVALQDEQIAVSVADQEIGYSVAIDVGDRQAGGLEPRIVAHGLLETSLAVAQHDASPGWCRGGPGPRCRRR